MTRVSHTTPAGIYSAELSPDGIVCVYLDGGWVGEGRWTGTSIEIREKLLEGRVRAELEREMREAALVPRARGERARGL